jgi:hypothetical protein
MNSRRFILTTSPASASRLLPNGRQTETSDLNHFAKDRFHVCLRKPPHVWVRILPRAPLLNPSAVIEISSGASTTATMSYSPSVQLVGFALAAGELSVRCVTSTFAGSSTPQIRGGQAAERNGIIFAIGPRAATCPNDPGPIVIAMGLAIPAAGSVTDCASHAYLVGPDKRHPGLRSLKRRVLKSANPPRVQSGEGRNSGVRAMRKSAR